MMQLVLPLILLVILLGLLSPFAVTAYKRRQLAANEQAVLRALREYARAQARVFANAKCYARSLAEIESPLRGAEMDASQGGDFYGYHFRVLTSQGSSAPGGAKQYVDDAGRMTGGYGLLAVPLKYGFTGRDTFLLSKDGVYYVDWGVRTEEATQNLRYFTVPENAQKIE